MIGAFSFEKGAFCGQDVKNTLIYEYFLKENIDVKAFDTSEWRGKVVNIIKNLLYITLTQRPNIMLCSHAVGVSMILIYLVFYKYLFRRKITYTVVGYEINDLIDKYFFLKLMLKQFDKIIVETKMHKNFLISRGILNVTHINNFRNIENNSIKNTNKTRQKLLKVIYFTRIDYRKPIKKLVDIVKYINSNNLQENYSFNIFGKVASDYEESFFSEISDIKNITYHGIMDSKEITNKFMDYDVMIYPQTAKEDVFPGVFLEAFSGKVPVIAINSNYISEIIKDNINGFLIKSNDNEAWLERLELKKKMPDDEYYNFSESTYSNALMYDTKTIVTKLIELFEKDYIL